jgi:ribonuclease BN (tRNA processing enzyme)
MLGLSRLRRPLLALTVLWSSAQALGESTDMTMDDPRLARTVTERPFEVVIDRRACGTRGVYVQVLGAGADDLGDAQASSGYLVWVDGKARVLIDMGTGSALRFEESGADFKDLYAVGLSQLHVEHSADLPAFLQGAANIRRKEDLPLFGPAPGEKTLGLKTWTSRLLGPNGAYPHLADYFSPFSQGGFEVQQEEIESANRRPWRGFRRDGIALSAIATDHGQGTSLAWRVDVGEVGITFTGDTGNRRQTVKTLAEGSTIIVGHHAVPENVRGFARDEHMPPSQLAKIAEEANANLLILSHRTPRTRGRELQTRREIESVFKGAVLFANDMECWEP